jgi:hypothetical protein
VLIGGAFLRVPLHLHDPIGQVFALVRFDRPLGGGAPAESEGSDHQQDKNGSREGGKALQI